MILKVEDATREVEPRQDSIDVIVSASFRSDASAAYPLEGAGKMLSEEEELHASDHDSLASGSRFEQRVSELPASMTVDTRNAEPESRERDHSLPSDDNCHVARPTTANGYVENGGAAGPHGATSTSYSAAGGLPTPPSTSPYELGVLAHDERGSMCRSVASKDEAGERLKADDLTLMSISGDASECSEWDTVKDHDAFNEDVTADEESYAPTAQPEAESAVQPADVKEFLGPDQAEVAFDLHGRAQTLQQQGKYDEAELLFAKASRKWQRAFGPNHALVADALNNWATLLMKQGKLEAADGLYVRVLTILRRDVGEEHANYASVLNNRAGLLRAQGKHDEAETLCIQALRIWEASLGSDHPQVAIALNNHAELLRAQGKYQDADPLYERAAKIDELAYGSDHPEVAVDLNNRAESLRAQGRYTEAEPLCRRALQIWKKAVGGEHPDYATALNNLAGYLAEQSKFDEAQEMYEEALSIDEAVYGPTHAEVATDLNNFAWLLEMQGRYREAEGLYERSQAMREETLGAKHPDVLEILDNRVALLHRQDRHQDAAVLQSRFLAACKGYSGGSNENAASGAVAGGTKVLVS